MPAEQEHAKAIAESWAETEHEPRVSDNDNDVVLARGYLALATELLAAQEREKDVNIACDLALQRAERAEEREKALREALERIASDEFSYEFNHEIAEEALAASPSEKPE